MGQIRVLHLRSSQGLYGAERVILALSQSIQQRGGMSIIGSLYDLRSPTMDFPDEAQRRGLDIRLIPCRGRCDRKAISMIRRFVRSEGITVIHTHGFKADFYGWWVSRSTHVPVIATSHGYTHAGPWVKMWERLDLLWLKKFNAVAAVSNELIRFLLRAGISESILSYIPNGIDVPECEKGIAAAADELGWKPLPIIGLTARLSPEKGIFVFLEAAREIHRIRPDTRFVILGDGPLRAELEDWIVKHEMEQVVRLLGFRQDIQRWYDCMTVVVLSSFREGMPMVLLEAMASGKPIVATRVGEIPELLERPKAGLLVDPGNSGQLAKAVLRILNKPSLALLLSRNARRQSQKYSWVACSDAYWNLYKTQEKNI